MVNPQIISDIPGDKSISHRAIILGALAENNSEFHNFLCAEDCLNTAKIFSELGVPVELHTETATVKIKGQGLRGLKAPKDTLDVGNSGTGIRLITGVLAAQTFSTTITGDKSIQKRPMKRIITPLTKMGAKISGQALNDNIVPPLHISGQTAITSTTYDMPMASAQVKSAILLAGLFANGTTTVIEPAPSRNHTEVMLSNFGVPVTTKGNTICLTGPATLKNPNPDTPIWIPSDFSSAAFFIILGLIGKTPITTTGIGLNPSRAALVDVLIEMGANIKIENTKTGVEPYGDITANPSTLKNGLVPKAVIPYIIDEIPILAIAACFGNGPLTVKNAEELRVKESDRIAAIGRLVTALGAGFEEFEDGFTLTPPTTPIPNFSCETFGDHRIAMSALIAAKAAGVTAHVSETASIQTSFPNFLAILGRLA